MFEYARSGCLSSLTELHVSAGRQDFPFDCRDFSWTSLNTLRISAPENNRVKAAIVVTLYEAVKNKCLTGLIQLFLISFKLKMKMSDFSEEISADKLIDVALIILNEHVVTQVSRFSAEEFGSLAAENPVTSFYKNPEALEFVTSCAPFLWNNFLDSFGLPLKHVRILPTTFSEIFEAVTRFFRGEIDSEQMAEDGFKAIQKTCDKHYPFSNGEMYKPMIKSLLKSSVENIPTHSVLTPFADLGDSIRVLFTNIYCLRRLGVLVYNEYSEK